MDHGENHKVYKCLTLMVGAEKRQAAIVNRIKTMQGATFNPNRNWGLPQWFLLSDPPLFFLAFLPFILIPFSVLDLGPVPAQLAAKMFHLNLKVVVPGSPGV